LQGGSRLSGGQRLRVGIARALYANTSTVLLDDPFSALDRKTSTAIMDYIVQISEKEKRCIVIVTNDVNILAKGVHSILVLSGGQLVDSGGYEEMCASSAAFQALREEVAVRGASEEEESEERVMALGDSSSDAHGGGSLLRTLSSASVKESPIRPGRGAGEEGEEENDEKEHMERGEIDGNVISTYFKAIGFGVVALILFSTFCMQVMYDTNLKRNLIFTFRLLRTACLFGWRIGQIILTISAINLFWSFPQ
jgi:ABC-type multidrug transport system ATPase subunit